VPRAKATAALLTVAGLAAALTVIPTWRPSPAPAPAPLPDLDPRAPAAISVAAGRHRHLLVFASAADNLGAGLLIVTGRRARGQPTMHATQHVRRADGTEHARPAGRLRYVRSPDHSHWHYQRFMRYALRRAGDGRLVRRDRKSGFCLGDRYDAAPTRRLPDEPPLPAFATDCGRGRPTLCSLREGISVGHGDDYGPRLHGQSIDITGLPPGRYLLIHRANPDHGIAETDHTNKAASALIGLTRPRGPERAPRLAVLARCPQSEHCVTSDRRRIGRRGPRTIPPRSPGGPR
jgi:hypothetical protein